MNLEEKLQKMSFGAVLTMSVVLGLALLAAAIAYLEGVFNDAPLFVTVLFVVVMITTIAWLTVQALESLRA